MSFAQSQVLLLLIRGWQLLCYNFSDFGTLYAGTMALSGLNTEEEADDSQAPYGPAQEGKQGVCRRLPLHRHP